MHIGLQLVCPLSSIITFMEIISRAQDGGLFWGPVLLHLCFLQMRKLWWLPATKAYHMCLGSPQLSAKSAMPSALLNPSQCFLTRKWWLVFFRLEGICCIKYHGVVLTSDGRMEWKINGLNGVVALVMRMLHRSVIIKRELSQVSLHFYPHLWWWNLPPTRSGKGGED